MMIGDLLREPKTIFSQKIIQFKIAQQSSRSSSLSKFNRNRRDSLTFYIVFIYLYILSNTMFVKIVHAYVGPKTDMLCHVLL